MSGFKANNGGLLLLFASAFSTFRSLNMIEQERAFFAALFAFIAGVSVAGFFSTSTGHAFWQWFTKIWTWRPS